MLLAINFTNFGPYHLARLRALAAALTARGDRLVAYETASSERKYPWQARRGPEPFVWHTLFPGRDLESIGRPECASALRAALEQDDPDAVALVGYVRPESLAALGWARRQRKPAILLSESQRIDHPRVWWKEAIKGRRVRRCAAGLVGGPRHRDYLARLGLPAERIALGYNAVDNDEFARAAMAARLGAEGRSGLPDAPYFVAVSRFVPEKNLPLLVRAFARYRREAEPSQAWDLMLIGDGPDAAAIDETARAEGLDAAVHRPGFLQAGEIARRLAFASGFVHPSTMEPWGLVVNEAAACGLPLLVSERAGCAETLVPEAPLTGRRFDPANEERLAACLGWLAGLAPDERRAIGRNAAEVVALWGPDRFARGMLEAVDIAFDWHARAARRAVGRRATA